MAKEWRNVWINGKDDTVNTRTPLGGTPVTIDKTCQELIDEDPNEEEYKFALNPNGEWDLWVYVEDTDPAIIFNLTTPGSNGVTYNANTHVLYGGHGQSRCSDCP